MKISMILGFSKLGAHTSAHVTHYKTIAYSEQGKARHVIYKENKHSGREGEQASELEACFTSVANALFAPHRALRQDIVTGQNGHVVGVTSEHAAHALLRMRRSQPDVAFLQTTTPFPSADKITAADFQVWLDSHKKIPSHGSKWEHLRAVWPFVQEYTERLNDYENERERIGESRSEQSVAEWAQLRAQCIEQELPNAQQERELSALGAGKGFNFLDKLPQNFFAKLLEAQDDGKLDIDMDSLADVFTTAYALEEDDLHKGNIGYYVTEEQGRPCFHFFKIDHDLMFSNKVMAARDGRLANLAYTHAEFRITARDLQGFPDLLDSGNHYWPTKHALFVKGDKAYQSEADRSAYKSLKNNEQFAQAKWRRFLKQTVVPNDFIVRCLKQPLERADVDPEMANTLTVVQRATASRMSELRIALVEVPEFRRYLAEHGDEAQKSIISEISQHAASIGCSEEEIKKYSFAVKEAIKSMVLASELSTSDTPLHTAVHTQSYRSYETAKLFKDSLNNVDKDGLTALDHALSQFEIACSALKNINAEQEVTRVAWGYYESMQMYSADVICDLSRNGAAYTQKNAEQYQEILALAQKRNSLSMLPVVKSLDDYKKTLGIIRSNTMSSLKNDKVSAVVLLEKAHLNKDELEQLREELIPDEPAAPLKFIKELRSEIWIVKKIRGAYGDTSTLDEMQTLIKEKIKALDSKNEGSIGADDDRDILLNNLPL